MQAASPPASPSKRTALLRSLVTGVGAPVDRDTHAERWNRAPTGNRATPTVAPSQGSAPASPSTRANGSGVRVASLVQGWEEASLGARSQPYDALAPRIASPTKTSFGQDAQSALRVEPNANLARSNGPVSPTRGVSPTVPASFFQMQAKRSTNTSPTKFDPQLRNAAGGKENQPTSDPRFATHEIKPAGSARPVLGASQLTSGRALRASTMSARTDLSSATDARTAITVGTMATRSSDSTHAPSLVSTVAGSPNLGESQRMEARKEEATRFGTFDRSTPNLPRPEPPRPPPPQSAVLPSPGAVYPGGAAQRGDPPRASPPIRSDSAAPCASRPAVQHRPASSFIEALPSRPSAPSPASSSSSPSHAWFPEESYAPLPLDRPDSGSDSRHIHGGQPGPPKRRPRSSSMGEGLRPATLQQAEPVETGPGRTKRIEAEFARLLDTMQLPDATVRTKMLGLALPLKEEMLRTASSPAQSVRAPQHQRGRSMNVVSSNGKTDRQDKKDSQSASGIKTLLRKAKSNSSLRGQAAREAADTTPVVDSSVTSGRRDRSRSHTRTNSASSGVLRGFRKPTEPASAGTAGVPSTENETSAYWAKRLRTGTIDALEVKELGRLRGRLRTESPAWMDDFVRQGGYVALLERLKDLLDKEWREEQHDDQVLHEVLRCFKALTMTSVGKRTLASHSPTPFLPMAALLFSEKRPGDLPCRQILVELLHSLFQICPPGCDSLPKSAWASTEVSLQPVAQSSPTSAGSPASSGYESGSGGVRRYTRRIKSSEDETTLGSSRDSDTSDREEVLAPERVQQAHRFVVSLMQGPPDEEEEAKVDFIQRAHRARPYKVWVKEIADCVRDYFWVFCHANNLFWTLEQIDAEAIECPKVPSGMTGGVEYEAMAYCTTHLRLINEIARTCPTQAAAFAFHEQLFLSGFERVLFTLRRASLVYYQSLHLEMSRYISLARTARFNLGPRILACLDRRFLRPEEQMVLEGAERRNHQSRSGAPQIGAIF